MIYFTIKHFFYVFKKTKIHLRKENLLRFFFHIPKNLEIININ